MYYGDLVTVVPDKIRISEKELAPIGILDQSVCWSRWVPDRWVAFDAVQPPPHLVISPFEIASWPVLFRLSIFLEDGQGGALAKALHVLAANAFNILAIEGTPAGHHHAVVNVIGEAVEIKFDANTLDAISSFDDRERNFKNGALAANIHQIYAPRLLSYSRRLVEALQDADAGADGRFLRHSFALHRKTDRPRGILYNAEDLPPEVADIGHEQSTRAVTCKWLQNHAFFWIYGEGDVSEKKLIYNARTWALRPEAVWKHQFGETIARLKPPFKAISSINFEEQYLRLTFSPYDRRGNTFRLKLPYAARFSAPGITTQGALAAICATLANHQLTLRSVAAATEYRDSSDERGSYTLLASMEQLAAGAFKSLTEPEKLSLVERAALDAAEAATSVLGKEHCAASFAPPAVSVFAGRTLFVSTKFDWVKSVRPKLIARLRSRAAHFGYVLVLADLDFLDEDHRFLWDGGAPITSNIIRLMRSSDAFLQIIPRSAIEATIELGSLNWVLFESGAAHALHIPCAIAVDSSGDKRLSDWVDKLKAGTERKVFFFASDQDDEQIIDSMEPALEFLANEGRPNRTGRFFASGLSPAAW